jgi:NitT/TauT family transport system substrate-binding protein
MSAWRAAMPAMAGVLLAAALTRGAAAGEINLKFTLDRPFEGPAAPLLLPLDRGFYKAEGLNVSVDPAANSLEAITRIASGAYDMGVADINALIKFRDANPKIPITAVFIVYNKPAFAVIGRKSRGVTAPKELEGKRLAVTMDGDVFSALPIFIKANNIDASKMTIENVGAAVRAPMLAAGQVDAITGLSFSSLIDLKDKGLPTDDLVPLLMADHGVKLYGDAIIVGKKFADDRPEAVRGFLRAFLKGMKMTVKNPASTITVVLERSGANKNLELERLKMVIHDSIVTAEVKANGYGGIDVGRFAEAIDQIALSYKFKSAKPDPEDIFDASYLPPAGERKIN